MTLFFSISWFVIVACLILRAVRQGSVISRLNPALPIPKPPSGSIEIIVPARDEAKNIEACLAAMLRQLSGGSHQHHGRRRRLDG